MVKDFVSKLKFWESPEKKKAFLKSVEILIILFIFAGIAGFVYEELFYRIDLGYWDKRGSCFGPWVIIYSYGALLILGITYPFRKKWYLVMPVSMLITGSLEYLSGYYYWVYQGIRYWDYNVEIWNWGNIGGYICARSVIMFGLMSLFLQFVARPLAHKFADKVSRKALAAISFGLLAVFIVDHLVYALLNPATSPF